MILLEILFSRHYVFAVVQTASKPHPTRGRTTLTARAKQPSDRSDESDRSDGSDGSDESDGKRPPAPRTLSFSRKRLKAPSQPERLRHF